jgi:Spy/CpxP family protein refolding chaperone
MKRGWTLILLVSLGLNIGLGLRLLRPGHPTGVQDPVALTDPAAAPPSWERPAPGDSTAWSHYMGRRMQHLITRLDLRPDQVDGFRSAQAATGHLLREKRREVFQGRLQLRRMMAEDNADRQVLRQAMVALGRLQAEMDSLAADTLLREMEVLDPAQRAAYLDLLPTDGRRHDGRGGPGHERRGR